MRAAPVLAERDVRHGLDPLPLDDLRRGPVRPRRFAEDAQPAPAGARRRRRRSGSPPASAPGGRTRCAASTELDLGVGRARARRAAALLPGSADGDDAVRRRRPRPAGRGTAPPGTVQRRRTAATVRKAFTAFRGELVTWRHRPCRRMDATSLGRLAAAVPRALRQKCVGRRGRALSATGPAGPLRRRPPRGAGRGVRATGGEGPRRGSSRYMEQRPASPGTELRTDSSRASDATGFRAESRSGRNRPAARHRGAGGAAKLNGASEGGAGGRGEIRHTRQV